MAVRDAGWLYPEVDDVVSVMAGFGVAGLRDAGALAAACAAPRASAGGVDVHLDTVAKAAALAWSVCRFHPFVDGNKRCSAVLLPYFCLTNGLDPRVSPAELGALILELAGGGLDRDELTAWLRPRCGA